MRPSLLALNIAFGALVGSAWAVPPRGAQLPPVTIEDVDGHRHTLPERHLPTLVFYEDRRAGTQNHALHQRLSRVADRPANRDKLDVVPIGDIEAYDFWPARKIVLSVIRERMRQENAPILCDWTGAVRRSWNLTHHLSGNVLLDAEGRVLFAGEGPLSDAQIKELLDRLAELGVDVR
jgi:hypothetical protein